MRSPCQRCCRCRSLLLFSVSSLLTFLILSNLWTPSVPDKRPDNPPDKRPDMDNAEQEAPLVIEKQPAGNKFAYVFYVTSSDYICYALVNSHRLIHELNSNSSIDIVILAIKNSKIERFCVESCFPTGRVKIKTIHEAPELTQNVYYAQSYLRFEAFRLIEYDRIIVMDADGFVVRNIDKLFELDMENREIAATHAHYLAKKWISSIFMLVKPSLHLHKRLTGYLNADRISAVSAFANGSHYDMDILNLEFDRGAKAKILPERFAILDSQVADRYQWELSETYYVHFTAKKPIDRGDTRPWPLETNSAVQLVTVDRSNRQSSMDRLYEIFWRAFDKRCRNLVTPAPLLPPIGEERNGMYDPDPRDMAEFINNMTRNQLMIDRW